MKGLGGVGVEMKDQGEGGRVMGMGVGVGG